MKLTKIIIASTVLCFTVNMCGNSGKGDVNLDKEFKAILETKNGTEAYSAITDIATKYEIKNGYKALTPIGKLLYNVFWVEGEVNNGGFNQYFYNSAGDHAIDAIESLNSIGASQTKELLQSAIDKFPNSTVPTNRDERINVLKSIDPNNSVFNDLDDRFYKLEEDRADLTVQYIKSKIQ